MSNHERGESLYTDIQILKLEAAFLKNELDQLEKLSEELGRVSFQLLTLLESIQRTPTLDPIEDSHTIYKIERITRDSYLPIEEPVDLLVRVDGEDVEVAFRPTLDRSLSWSPPHRGKIIRWAANLVSILSTTVYRKKTLEPTIRSTAKTAGI